jgi:lambda family phage portal protein
MIGYISPRAAAERAYYVKALELLPKLAGDPEPVDERPYPRGYARESDDNAAQLPESQAIYNSANQSRVDRGWPLSQSLRGPNAALNRWRLLRMRDRARELDRNNVLVTGMLDRATENVIGHGMRVRPTTDDADFNDRVEELWNDWITTADITGMCGAAEYQRMLHRCFLRDGDVGINLVSRTNGFTGASDCYLQAIEGDLIDTLTGGYDLANNVVNGIQFNEDGKPTAFYVVGISLNGVQREAYPVRARDFVFYARRKSFSQVRGEPCFAQVDRLFDQIDGYVEASVVAARIAACQGLYIRRGDSAKQLGNLPTQLNAKNNPQRLKSMEPGMIEYGSAGDEVTQIKPEHPTQTFADFISTLLRFTGLTLGLPLELVFLDFSRTTYSSARASLLQSYRAFRSQQQVFIDRVMSRIYQWRVSKWVKDGTLIVPDAIASTYWSHEWIAPGWAWIDPVKEIQAAMMEVDAGFNSEENIALQHGRTLEDIYKSKKKAKDLAAKLVIDVSKSGLTREAVLTPNGVLPPKTIAAPDDKTDPETGEDVVETDE